MNDEELRRYVERLADREALDWAAAERELPAPHLRGLRRVESIASAYRRAARAGAGTPRFSRLLLIERVGGGAGGDVWRAHDPLLDRDVALKLRVADDRDAQARSQLLDEARVLARVDHPSLLRVLGADLNAGRLGVWSEFLDGENLDARREREGRIGAEEARSLGASMCAALAALHVAGFVHGDIKPANVMRTRAGRYVLCDLGSAVALRGGGERQVSGTPLYLAPEVAAGGAPGVASDLYALGATLYRQLAGEAPIEADTLPDLLEAHRQGRRSRLRDARPDLPAALVAAIDRALDPDPAKRYASAGEFEAALAGARKPSWVPALAAAALAAVAIAALALLRPQTVPIAQDLRWFRGDGAAPLFDGADVRRGDTLYADLRCTRACWLYVFAEDGAHVTSRLFPAAGTQANPLAPSAPLRLPGKIAGDDRHWRVGPAQGESERLLLVVAARALAPAETETIAAVGDATDTAIAGETFRGIDALVRPPGNAAGGLDDIARRLRTDASTVELHWLRLRRSDFDTASAAQSR